MKSMIALLALLPVMSFAGTCYQATSQTPYGVPAKLCFDSIVETEVANQLRVESTDGSAPTTLNIDWTSRHNEDRVRFGSSAVLVDYINSGCGDKLFALLKVEGEFITGDIPANFLKVSVDTESTPDICHARAQFETIEYKLVN